MATLTLAMTVDTVESASGFYPDYEEVRMARAVASSIVMEAVAIGESHGSFHGFRIDAARLIGGHKNAFVMCVELVVCLDGHMIDREIAEILPLYFD